MPLPDHLGTVHALTDANGVIVESYKYDAWGRVLEIRDGNNNKLTSDLGTPISALGNRYLWQGREYSYTTGLYYFRARWYDPITGSWLSKDPIGISGGLNQYVFCGNNGVNFVDPQGLDYATTYFGLYTHFNNSFYDLALEQQECIRFHELIHRTGKGETEAYAGEVMYAGNKANYYMLKLKNEKNKPKPDPLMVLYYRHKYIAYSFALVDAEIYQNRNEQRQKKPWYKRYIERCKNYYGGESEE